MAISISEKNSDNASKTELARLDTPKTHQKRQKNDYEIRWNDKQGKKISAYANSVGWCCSTRRRGAGPWLGVVGSRPASHLLLLPRPFLPSESSNPATNSCVGGGGRGGLGNVGEEGVFTGWGRRKRLSRHSCTPSNFLFFDPFALFLKKISFIIYFCSWKGMINQTLLFFSFIRQFLNNRLYFFVTLAPYGLFVWLYFLVMLALFIQYWSLHAD